LGTAKAQQKRQGLLGVSGLSYAALEQQRSGSIASWRGHGVCVLTLVEAKPLTLNPICTELCAKPSARVDVGLLLLLLQDVHREAMREAQNIARRDGPRLDRMGSGRGMDRGK
jgi:hypothetical protein